MFLKTVLVGVLVSSHTWSTFQGVKILQTVFILNQMGRSQTRTPTSLRTTCDTTVHESIESPRRTEEAFHESHVIVPFADYVLKYQTPIMLLAYDGEAVHCKRVSSQ